MSVHAGTDFLIVARVQCHACEGFYNQAWVTTVGSPVIINSL